MASGPRDRFSGQEVLAIPEEEEDENDEDWHDKDYHDEVFCPGSDEEIGVLEEVEEEQDEPQVLRYILTVNAMEGKEKIMMHFLTVMRKRNRLPSKAMAMMGLSITVLIMSGVCALV